MDDDDVRDRLSCLDASSVPAFSLRGTRTWARVLSCHDGDTATLAIPTRDGIFAYSCRLARIDASELNAARPEERAAARAARDRLFQLLTGGRRAFDPAWRGRKDVQAALALGDAHLVWVECDAGEDKYGRPLVELYSAPASASFSDVLLAEGLAAPYRG